MWELGSRGNPPGDYGLGYGGLDRNVRTGCQCGGRPTTTGHDRGHCSPGNVSKVARVHFEVDARRACAFIIRTTRILAVETSAP